MHPDLTEFEVLVNACLDGLASEMQLERLNQLLRSDPAMLDAYIQMADLNSCLALDAAKEGGPRRVLSESGMAQGRDRGALFSLRPLQAAAAGLIIGLLGASAVWAYSLPKARMEAGKIIPLLSEGFEDTAWLPEPGFPTRTGAWFGDLVKGVSASEECSAKEGRHVVALRPSQRQKFSYAFRIFDLSEVDALSSPVSYSLEVSASFHGSSPGAVDRYQIRLAAFREEPAAIKPMWNGGTLFDYLLKHVARTVNAREETDGWQTLKETIEIPPGTRSIVVSLAAGMASESAAKALHYLDDIQVRLVPSHSSN